MKERHFVFTLIELCVNSACNCTGDAERDGDAHSNDDLATELAAIAVKVEPTSFRVDDDVADDDMFADESVSVKLEESSMLQTNIDNDEKQGESTVTKSEPECSKTGE